jgi:hypothetical protein
VAQSFAATKEQHERKQEKGEYVKKRDEFVIGPKEKLIEAITSGKTKEALRGTTDLYESFRGMHDGFVNQISLLHAKLAEANGEEWLEGFTRNRLYQKWRSIFQTMKKMSPEQRVNMICDIHRPMYSEFHVEEDDEKFAVVVTACNNGGRLMRDGIAKQQNALTKKAYPWCFNRAGVPYYCIHAAIFNEIFKELGLTIEMQWGRQYDDQGKQIDEPCKYMIYK